MNLSLDLESYFLDNDQVIDHTKINFINHVYQPMNSVNFVRKFENNKEIKEKCHAIFEDPSFVKRIKYLVMDENNIHGGFVLPIGNVITKLFSDFKPPPLKLLGGLYEYIIDQLCWEIKVTRKTKERKKYSKKKKNSTDSKSTSIDENKNITKKRIRSTIDDVANPIGEVIVKCKLCDECFSSSFTLHKSKSYNNEEDTYIRTQTMACLEYFCDEHFNVCNRASPSEQLCSKLPIAKMKNIRDEEMFFVGHVEHLQQANAASFQILMRPFLQLHLESSSILQYFNWQNFRPTRFARSSKLISTKEKLKETEAAVLGTNEKKLRQQISDKQRMQL